MAKNIVFCAQCHRQWDETRIVGKNGIPDDDQPWMQVKPGRPAKSAWWSRKPASSLTAVEAIAADYQPYCPNDHLIVEALFHALGEPYMTVGLVGNLSSSKSCVIAAIFAEVARRGVLGGLGITASTFQSQDAAIDKAIDDLYRLRRLPEATRAGDPITGLVLRLQWPDGRRMNVVFYDVAGEVITSMKLTAEAARFVYSSAAYIMLLDPDGFPTEGSMFDSAGGNKLVTSKEVVGLADGLEQVRGVRPDTQRLPLILTVPKADKVTWADGAWPPPDTLGHDPASIENYLALSSEAVERHLLGHGLGNVVNAARARFGDANVRFSRVSALGQDPDVADGAIRPVGVWQVVLELLHSLDMRLDLAPAS